MVGACRSTKHLCAFTCQSCLQVGSGRYPVQVTNRRALRGNNCSACLCLTKLCRPGLPCSAHHVSTPNPTWLDHSTTLQSVWCCGAALKPTQQTTCVAFLLHKLLPFYFQFTLSLVTQQVRLSQACMCVRKTLHGKSHHCRAMGSGEPHADARRKASCSWWISRTSSVSFSLCSMTRCRPKSLFSKRYHIVHAACA